MIYAQARGDVLSYRSTGVRVPLLYHSTCIIRTCGTRMYVPCMICTTGVQCSRERATNGMLVQGNLYLVYSYTRVLTCTCCWIVAAFPLNSGGEHVRTHVRDA